ncbi:hypothetical protein HDU93_003443 [Gonapodya sp. JEL0774]|nr:hypothetical protein HDU93_003443 [Gonapodya sp. JEL0774]
MIVKFFSEVLATRPFPTLSFLLNNLNDVIEGTMYNSSPAQQSHARHVITTALGFGTLLQDIAARAFPPGGGPQTQDSLVAKNIIYYWGRESNNIAVALLRMPGCNVVPRTLDLFAEEVERRHAKRPEAREYYFSDRGLELLVTNILTWIASADGDEFVKHAEANERFKASRSEILEFFYAGDIRDLWGVYLSLEVGKEAQIGRQFALLTGTGAHT